jgi:hypothetical protein
MQGCLNGECLQLGKVEDGNQGHVRFVEGEKLDAEDLVQGDVEEHCLFVKCCGMLYQLLWFRK